MTASQQPDAEHASLTSPAAAGSGPTGHDKAVNRLGEHLEDESVRIDRDLGTIGSSKIATAALDWLRAALAAGDAAVAEALGGKIDERFSPRFVDDGPCNGRCQTVACDDSHRGHRLEWRNLRRFVTDWTEA